MIRICTDPACAMKGGEQILEAVCKHYDVAPGGTSPDGAVTVERVPCLGLCEHAPAALVNKTAQGRITIAGAEKISLGEASDPLAFWEENCGFLTANCGKGRATTLAEYLAGGGFEGLRRALGLTPTQVIEEIKTFRINGPGRRRVFNRGQMGKRCQG